VRVPHEYRSTAFFVACCIFALTAMAQIALKLLYETRMESNSHAVASDKHAGKLRANQEGQSELIDTHNA
jgi:hypothetical protein